MVINKNLVCIIILPLAWHTSNIYLFWDQLKKKQSIGIKDFLIFRETGLLFTLNPP